MTSHVGEWVRHASGCHEHDLISLTPLPFSIFVLTCVQSLHLLAVCLVLYFPSSMENLTNLVESLLHALIYFLLCTPGVEGENPKNEQKLAPIVEAQTAL